MDLTEQQKIRMEVNRLRAISRRVFKSSAVTGSGSTMPLATLFPSVANAPVAATTLARPTVDSAYEPVPPAFELPTTPLTQNTSTVSTSASLPSPLSHHSQGSDARRILEFPEEANQSGIIDVLSGGPSASQGRHSSRIGYVNIAGGRRHMIGHCVLLNTLSSDEQFKVDIGYHYQLVKIFKTIPSGEYVEKERRWIFSIGDHDTLMLKVDRLQDITIFPLPNSVLARFHAGEDTEYLISRLHPVLRNALYPFQLDGIRFGIKKNGRVLIADDMGLGKTIQGIGIASIYQEEWPLLVVCPSSLKYTWTEAFLRWIPSLDHKTIQVVNSKEDYIQSTDTRVFVMSYTMLVGKKDELIEKNIKVAILDESHFVKNRRSLRATAAMEVLEKAAHVILLSGTPAIASPIDLYTQLHLIAPQRFRSVSSFIRRYCYNHEGYFDHRSRENGAHNQKELAEKLRKWLMIRRTKREVLTDLPPKQRQKIVLNPRAMKVVNPILERFNNMAGLMTRQDAFTYFRETAEFKLPAVRKYVEDLLEGGEKFLVFAHHNLVVKGICRTIKKRNVKYIWIDGSVDSKSRLERINKFQEDADCKVAVLSLTAACFGLTLTASRRVVFAELYWDPGSLRQAEDRVHRISQDGTVLIQYLVAEDTMDDHIWNIINNKNDRIKRLGLTEDSFGNVSTIEQEYSADLDDILARLDADDDDDEISDDPEDTAMHDESDGLSSDVGSCALDYNFSPSSSCNSEDENSGIASESEDERSWTAAESEENTKSEVTVHDDNNNVDDNGGRTESFVQSSNDDDNDDDDDDDDEDDDESGSERDSDYIPVDETKSSEPAAAEKLLDTSRSRKSARLIDRKLKNGEDDDEDNDANPLIVRRKATGTSEAKRPSSKFQKLIENREKRLTPKLKGRAQQNSVETSSSDDDTFGNVSKRRRIKRIESDSSDDTSIELGGTRGSSDLGCNIHETALNVSDPVLQSIVGNSMLSESGDVMGRICRKSGNSKNKYANSFRKTRNIKMVDSDNDTDASVGDSVTHHAKENYRNSKITKKKQDPSVVRRCKKPRTLSSDDDDDSTSSTDVEILGTYNKKHNIPTIELSDDDCCSPGVASNGGRFC